MLPPQKYNVFKQISCLYVRVVIVDKADVLKAGLFLMAKQMYNKPCDSGIPWQAQKDQTFQKPIVTKPWQAQKKQKNTF